MDETGWMAILILNLLRYYVQESLRWFNVLVLFANTDKPLYLLDKGIVVIGVCVCVCFS